MDDLGHCFLINKCELYIAVGKKNGPRLVVFLQSVYGRGRKKYKNKRYLLTFRVGNAISTAASRALANVKAVTADRIPTVCVPRRGRRRKTFRAFLPAAPICSLLSPQPRVTRASGAGQGHAGPTPPGHPPPGTRARSLLSPSTQDTDAELPGGSPAAACSAEESLVALTHSDKIHFIGFVLQFDIGSWDSNFMSRTITIAAGTFKKCVYPFYFNSYIIKIYLCQTPYKGTI